ncbi:PQ loop repeat-domain-containing protein [Gymnopilus junonius]|uniref:PQ loop repeat-domain-containing protein n=1 Tax=Gymnopilus junonius TaxID=109634 RepID=A0A9P5NW70_GYMJU|nr:PQ loop repeat-domain-containing protein [Gymnopilus junonius]
MLTGDSLSSILGWISIACWIVVYSPQIYENFTLQSGEGLSVSFVIIWLLGDLTNLTGALLAGLLPTVILLAVYYTTCDAILLFQIYYYRWKNGRLLSSQGGPQNNGERAPLLGDELGIPNHIHIADEETVPVKTLVIRYLCALLFVITVGIAAWWLTKEEETHLVDAPQEGKKWWYIQFLGWSSASLFLGARIPQILKNFKTRCEGLSPALFFFAIFGNTTYALSICAKSMDKDYLITNGGWLAGSMLTVFLDIFVLCQFSYYRYTDEIHSQQRGS